MMAWHQTGDKPLSEPMMIQFNDAYMYYSTSVSQAFCDITGEDNNISIILIQLM